MNKFSKYRDSSRRGIRDLTRAREDLVSMERRAKQRLGAFLLRHGKVYTAGVKKWTKRYFRWLEEVKFDFPVQQIVFQEYVDTVTHLQGRVEALEIEMERVLPDWSLAPAWSYRFPARKTAHLQRRAKQTSESVQVHAHG